VLIIHRGDARGVGRIGELRAKYRGRYKLHWRGDGSEFLNHLRTAGVTVEANGHSAGHSNGHADAAFVETPGDWSVRRFFELSCQSDLTLREVAPQEEDLEELYHRVIGTQDSATDGTRMKHG
jgi:hypothetical protein